MSATLDIAALQTSGFAIIPELLPSATVAALPAACDLAFAALPSGARRRAGIRSAVGASPALAAVASSDTVMSVARAAIGESALLVRSILFDKSPEANWDVPWHRDTTIAVRERREAPGFGPWSLKEGTPHVQPPIGVLEGMVTLRIHIDPCPPENGALLVVPGSHRGAKLAMDTVDPGWCDERSRVCEVDAGGCLVMRPLLLHASRKSANASHRRVLHLEFAALPLPSGLEWAT